MKLLRRLTIVACIACCILALLQSIPMMAWSFYMLRATHLLKTYVHSNSNEQLYIPRLERSAKLDVIPPLLEKARQWRPHHPMAYRWLIKTNAVRQDWELAADVAMLAVAELAPDSGLLKNELAIPYLYRIGQQPICNEKIKSTFKNFDRWIESENSLTEFANLLVHQGQPVLARGAYCVADQVYGINDSPDGPFRDAVMAIMTRQSDLQERLHTTRINDSIPESYIVDLDSVTIRGAALYWVTPIPFYNVHFGTRLGAVDTEIGIFWWSGQGIAIIDVQHPGEFLITARVRDSDPASTEMVLGINGQRDYYFELTAGDNSWHDISFQATLEPGLHSIGVWFLNNEIIGSKDRDGAIQSLQIQPIGDY